MRFFWGKLPGYCWTIDAQNGCLSVLEKTYTGRKWGISNLIWCEIYTSFCIRILAKDVCEIYRVLRHCACSRLVSLSFFEEKTHIKTCAQSLESLVFRKNFKSVILDTFNTWHLRFHKSFIRVRFFGHSWNNWFSE